MIHKHGMSFMNEKSLEDFETSRKNVANKYPNICLDINKRWEDGTSHHPKAKLLVEKITELDFYFGKDYFRWKTGGDGDNGEHLLYLLDIIFENDERGVRSE